MVKTEELIPSKLRLMSPDVGGEVSLPLPSSLSPPPHCTLHQCNQTHKQNNYGTRNVSVLMVLESPLPQITKKQVAKLNVEKEIRFRSSLHQFSV